jgi:hypothetical protein
MIDDQVICATTDKGQQESKYLPLETVIVDLIFQSSIIVHDTPHAHTQHFGYPRNCDRNDKICS